jgi:hypothetical protein
MSARASFCALVLVLTGCPGPAPATDASPLVDAPALDTPPAADASAPDAPPAADAPALDVPPALDAPSGPDAPASLDAPTSTGSCDGRRVLCDALPPACGMGELPSVEGSCWGPCIPATRCTCSTPEECPYLLGYSETCYPARGTCGPYL